MTCSTLLTTTIMARGKEKKKRKINIIITALGYKTSKIDRPKACGAL